MYLFFDTETADKPRNWKAPAADVDNWPRLVQLGWICCESAGQPVASAEYLIRPEGFSIARGAAAVHGITTSKAREEGVALQPVLDEFEAAVEKSSVFVAHNINFDYNVLTAEFIRANRSVPIDRGKCRCTMTESTDFCELPGPYGNKWPKLGELYQILFNTSFEETHSARADAEACMKCFFQLVEMGIIR